jgi:DNA topoisomerase-1
LLAQEKTIRRTTVTGSASRLPTAEPATIRLAGLRYVNDDEPGLTRVRSGAGFRLRRTDGGAVHDKRLRARVRRLVIPPAWTDVWICVDSRGHIQAIGRDARGRKQYIYHPAWREARDRDKFDKQLSFAKALPTLRARVARDLAQRSLTKERVLATVVQLLDVTHIRVGNDEYARRNNSFGLTTLRDRHVRVNGGTLEFQFQGKSGKLHRLRLGDRRLARLVKACQDVPGQRLFQYLEDGMPRPVTSGDVNAYLREICGDDVTAKDFRTWAGTVLAAMALHALGTDGVRSTKRLVAAAVKEVAAQLGNTPTVCRKCYIHPAIIDGFVAGDLVPALKRRLSRRHRNHALSGTEAAVLAYLKGSERPRRRRDRSRPARITRASASPP